MGEGIQGRRKSRGHSKELNGLAVRQPVRDEPARARVDGGSEQAADRSAQGSWLQSRASKAVERRRSGAQEVSEAREEDVMSWRFDNPYPKQAKNPRSARQLYESASAAMERGSLKKARREIDQARAMKVRDSRLRARINAVSNILRVYEGAR